MSRVRRIVDEHRIKAKFRKVASKVVPQVGTLIVDKKRPKGARVAPLTGAERMKWIEEKAVRMSHHPACDCWMCKAAPRYDRPVAKRRAARLQILDEEE